MDVIILNRRSDGWVMSVNGVDSCDLKVKDVHKKIMEVEKNFLKQEHEKLTSQVLSLFRGEKESIVTDSGMTIKMKKL